MDCKHKNIKVEEIGDNLEIYCDYCGKKAVITKKECNQRLRASEYKMKCPLTSWSNSMIRCPTEMELTDKGAIRRFKKIGRNDPCGCGSGIKLKYCCRDFDGMVATVKSMEQERIVKEQEKGEGEE